MGLECIMKVKKGNPTLIGTTIMGKDVNFSVVVRDCMECGINIYEKNGNLVEKIKLDSSYKTGNIFSALIENFDSDRYEYCFEVMGNEFMDPYAKKVSGREEWGKPFDKKIAGKVRASIANDAFKWTDDNRSYIKYEDAIFYKAHVRGFTKHSSSRVKNPGTFSGLEQKLDYIKKIGVTSVILMPIYEFDEIIYDKYIMGPEEIQFIEYKAFIEEQKKQADPVIKHYERNINKKGYVPYKINYWGYGVEDCYYFAPKSSYASEPDNCINEFKSLVNKMHKLGLECILEFNFVPGIDKQFVYECFRHWMLEYHIDGFKYNANAINGEFVAADPLLASCKLICEGWNECGIYPNNAPSVRNLGMMNDDFLINVRKFLKGDEEQAGDFAYKFRRNSANVGIINYITNANGFTMNDLYSYDVKHNMDNYENGIDGTDYNYSWNCGIEGKTRKSKVLALRKKQIKNAFTLLLLSQGSPMILAGDEFLNSQDGNNNAYCQDNETTWLNWNLGSVAKSNLEYVKKLISLRKSHPIFHMKDELRVMDYVSLGCPDLSYHGTRAWYPEFSMYSRTLGIMLYGKYAGSKEDSSFYFAINMHWEEHDFDVPRLPDGQRWECIIDCDSEPKNQKNDNKELDENGKYLVRARDIVIFEAKPCEKKINTVNTTKKKLGEKVAEKVISNISNNSIK